MLKAGLPLDLPFRGPDCTGAVRPVIEVGLFLSQAALHIPTAERAVAKTVIVMSLGAACAVLVPACLGAMERAVDVEPDVVAPPRQRDKLESPN